MPDYTIVPNSTYNNFFNHSCFETTAVVCLENILHEQDTLCAMQIVWIQILSTFRCVSKTHSHLSSINYCSWSWICLFHICYILLLHVSISITRVHNIIAKSHTRFTSDILNMGLVWNSTRVAWINSLLPWEPRSITRHRVLPYKTGYMVLLHAHR